MKRKKPKRRVRSLKPSGGLASIFRAAGYKVLSDKEGLESVIRNGMKNGLTRAEVLRMLKV